MLKRTLFFSTPYCLSLRNGQMIIHTREAPDQRKSIPIEDIGFVVLEDQQTSITLPLLNALSERFFNEEDYLRLKDSYILTPDEFGFKQNAR